MTYVTRRELDENCLHYKEQFSRVTRAQSIKDNAIPSPPVRKATKGTDSAWMQSMSKSPRITHGEDPAIIRRKKKLTAAEEAALETPAGIVRLNRKGIALAVDNRIALFLQTAILCYKLPFYFKNVGADEQYGTAPSITYSSVEHKRQAAHSSTSPHVIAYPKDKTPEEGFNFLKGGFFEAWQNLTIGMHALINNTDSALDGRDDDGKLRDRAMEIVNRVADGLSPIKATKVFMKVMIEESDRLIEEWRGSDDFAERTKRLVARRYKKLTGDSLVESEKPEFFDRLMGYNAINPTDDKVRELVFKTRYHLFQFQETVEGKIAKLIHDTKAKMAVRDRNMIEHILLMHFSEKTERTVIEKLFAKSCIPFDDDYVAVPDKENPAAYKAFRTRVTNLRKKYKVLISRLERDLRVEFRGLICAEATMRSKVFKRMREDVKNWTGDKFCEELLNKTGRSVSNSWVNRVEQLGRIPRRDKETYDSPLTQRRRYLSIQDAKDCAAAFGVEGIFVAGLITSE